MRSITLSDSSFATLPAWARFVARFCLDHRVDRAGGNAMQAFTTRANAERWARAVMRALPKTYLDGDSAPRAWVLVYAMPDTIGRNLNPALHTISNAQCYLAIDNGGKVCKRHAIASGYHGHKRGTPARSDAPILVPSDGTLRPSSPYDVYQRRIKATGHHVGRRVNIGNGRYGKIVRMGSWVEGVCVLIEGTVAGYQWSHYEDTIPAGGAA
jgi:hypothetical protein